MDCSPPGSTVHGISQAGILEWGVISFSSRSSWPRDQTHISCIAGRFITTEPPGKPIWAKVGTEWGRSPPAGTRPGMHISTLGTSCTLGTTSMEDPEGLGVRGIDRIAHGLGHCSWGWLGKALAPHSNTLAWKIPRTEEPGRLQSMGSLRVGHGWVTSLSLFTFF